MAWQRVEPLDADMRYHPQWVDPDEADALLLALGTAIEWECHRIRLFGREVDSPRLSCWIGDADAVYSYSRTRFEPRPWPRALHAIRERLRDECGIEFNGVLANLYRDGKDSMGWHADDEAQIDPCAPIVSLSLGAVRRFTVRHRRDRTLAGAIELGHGSVLLMSGPMQRDWQHALPKSSRALGMRINLTFRRIVPGSDR